MISGFGVLTAFDVFDLAIFGGFLLSSLGRSLISFCGAFVGLDLASSPCTGSSSGPSKILDSSNRSESVLLRAMGCFQVFVVSTCRKITEDRGERPNRTCYIPFCISVKES